MASKNLKIIYIVSNDILAELKKSFCEREIDDSILYTIHGKVDLTVFSGDYSYGRKAVAARIDKMLKDVHPYHQSERKTKIIMKFAIYSPNIYWQNEIDGIENLVSLSGGSFHEEG